MPLEHQFEAMSTAITIGVNARCDAVAAHAAFAAVAALFERYEASLSRFRPDSELSALNRSAGRPFVCSPLLFAGVQAALDAAGATGGIYEPCVLGALLAAGYDRTFAIVALTEPREPPRSVPPPADSWRTVLLDAAARTVTLPEGVSIDLGGIGKGLAVDAALALLRPLGGCYVDAGGDLAAHGEAEDGPWRVGVQNPWTPDGDLALVTLRDAALATSSIARRRWRRGGVEQHHLIDPRTGRPAETDLVAATVHATTATRADVLAKCAVILGSDAGLKLVERSEASCLLVHADGGVVASSRWTAA